MHYQFMAPWVPLFVSAVDTEPAPFVLFQLATVDSHGWPHVRTVVYRGFLFDDKTTNVICCTTDKRMGKYQQIRANDRVEAVFWFPSLKRQFRLQGRARIIDDDHHPAISIPQAPREAVNSDDDDLLELAVPATKATPNKPLLAAIVSPSQLSQLHTKDDSYTTLAQFNLQPPLAQDWHDEIRRHWDKLLKPLRQLFRRPPPASDITDELLLLIDLIKRGVDGKKDTAGLVNFAVVALFADRVDVLDLERDKRWVYQLDDDDSGHSEGHWTEAEVCP